MKSAITVNQLKMTYLCSYVIVPIFWVSIYVKLWGWGGLISYRSIFVGVIIFFAGTPVHELIHYCCFVSFNGVDRKRVVINFDIRNVTANVVCSAATTSRRYRVSAILPFIVLGVVPSACGLVFHTPSIGIAGMLAVVSCTGDLVLFALLMRIGSTTLVSRYVSRHEGKITQLGFVSAS